MSGAVWPASPSHTQTNTAPCIYHPGKVNAPGRLRLDQRTWPRGVPASVHPLSPCRSGGSDPIVTSVSAGAVLADMRLGTGSAYDAAICVVLCMSILKRCCRSPVGVAVVTCCRLPRFRAGLLAAGIGDSDRVAVYDDVGGAIAGRLVLDAASPRP